MRQQMRSEFDFARWDEMVYRECKACRERKSMPKHRVVCLDCFIEAGVDLPDKG